MGTHSCPLWRQRAALPRLTSPKRHRCGRVCSAEGWEKTNFRRSNGQATVKPYDTGALRAAAITIGPKGGANAGNAVLECHHSGGSVTTTGVRRISGGTPRVFSWPRSYGGKNARSPRETVPRHSAPERGMGRSEHYRRHLQLPGSKICSTPQITAQWRP